MRIDIPRLLALLTFSTAAVAAPINKCVQPDGSIVYQDHVCSAEAKTEKVYVPPPPRLEDQLRATERLLELKKQKHIEQLERERAQADRLQAHRQYEAERAEREREACMQAIASDYSTDQLVLRDYASRLCAAGLSRQEMRNCMREFNNTIPGTRLTLRGADLHINTCIRMHGRHLYR